MNPRNWSLAIVSTQGFRTNTGSSFKIVYYRVYTPDAANHSKSAWDAKDQFLGRIAANSIPPPHNVGSLKRCIAHTEGLLEACGSSISLFVSPASQIPMSHQSRLHLPWCRRLSKSRNRTASASYASSPAS
ncbi:hypothetical protein B0H14DRAFT_2354892 [Mycena olivaceomarginata]|nr:hypothetical protein B0H14DRAFT_2354892 [Mycena olivaceomarginata]